MRAKELGRGEEGFVAWDEARGTALRYDPAAREYETPPVRLALQGEFFVAGREGPIRCRPAFDAYAAVCRAMSPERAAGITGISAEAIRAVAQTLWHYRPVAHWTWTGIEQHSNATQTDRAIAILHALTGSIDIAGGNLHFAQVPVNDVSGAELRTTAQMNKALGLTARPLGLAKSGWILSEDLYRAILDAEPYRVRGLVGFGLNPLLSHADAARGAAALRRLEVHVHSDLYLTPTAAYADIVLPVASAWEREGLRVGFGLDQEACELVQLRPAVIAPRGEARADIDSVFELAVRLGLGKHFWDGAVDSALDHYLAPSGLNVTALRAAPRGIRVPLETVYEKHRHNGFATPSGKVEIFSTTLRQIGQPPIPEFRTPYAESTGFPLTLTSAKTPLYCHSQYRNLARLRRLEPDPVAELSPSTAAEHDLAPGDWMQIATPHAQFRVRARFNPGLADGVVAAEHGWWQACPELRLPGYDPLASDGANLNLAIGVEAADPVSGAAPHRCYPCRIEKLVSAAAAES